MRQTDAERNRDAIKLIIVLIIIVLVPAYFDYCDYRERQLQAEIERDTLIYLADLINGGKAK